uniref:CCHC-type domain-containing protein n=1 Tax=Neolamprologus brichardi TaxID=32507 RepID=A0A3Q4H0A0_NEOBR
ISMNDTFLWRSLTGAGLMQKKGRGMHSGRARGRGRATHTPNSGFSTTCWRCGKEGHFVRDCKKQRRQVGNRPD